MSSPIQTDVAIIGGGGAGIPAAIEVARAGGKAIVLEQATECGGTAAISNRFGYMPISQGGSDAINSGNFVRATLGRTRSGLPASFTAWTSQQQQAAATTEKFAVRPRQPQRSRTNPPTLTERPIWLHEGVSLGSVLWRATRGRPPGAPPYRRPRKADGGRLRASAPCLLGRSRSP